MGTRDPKTLRKDAATLTAAYSGWVSDWIDISKERQVGLYFEYVKGDETSVELIYEYDAIGEEDGFERWRSTHPTFTNESTIIPLRPHAYQVTAADAAATQGILRGHAAPPNAGQMRVKAKKTGGSSPGTLKLWTLTGGH